MSRPDKDKDRGAYIGPPHSYHKSQVHICVITGLECQKIQHECASCVKTGLEYQNLTRFERAWKRGGRCTTGVALERDINQHMDAEREIAREQVRGET